MNKPIIIHWLARSGVCCGKQASPVVAADEARNPNFGRNFSRKRRRRWQKRPRAHRFRLAIGERPVDRHLADNLTSAAPQFVQADVPATERGLLAPIVNRRSLRPGFAAKAPHPAKPYRRIQKTSKILKYRYFSLHAILSAFGVTPDRRALS